MKHVTTVNDKFLPSDSGVCWSCIEVLARDALIHIIITVIKCFTEAIWADILQRVYSRKYNYLL